MTNQKHLKSRVRSRMAKTGERYAAARASIVATGEQSPNFPTGPTRFHAAGVHPETAAMRVLATAAGVVDPTTGAAPSEEFVLVAAGGIGAGAFAFHYTQFSSLYLAGRHRFDDSAGFVTDGLARIGVRTETLQTTSATAARRNLATLLEAGPVIAWCDFVELGTRGVPEQWAGGGYHVVTVYEVADDGTATIGDLRADPERVDAERFARARGRIAKDRTRLVGLAGPAGGLDLQAAVRDGLAACVAGLRNPRSGSFGLGALATLAGRMRGRSGKDAWVNSFPRGRWLLVPLRSIYEYVETSGTGGGLMRPMFGRGIAEAGAHLGDRSLMDLGERYAAIGRSWTGLAEAALPASVALFAETRAVLDERSAAFRRGAPSEGLRELWARQALLEESATDAFPLSDAEATDLVVDLADRLDAIVADETAALDELEAITRG
jgi:hypothetical protein